jgi:hypothetical protein
MHRTELLFCGAVYGAVFTAMCLLERRHIAGGKHSAVKGGDLYSSIGITLVIFFISNISFISKTTPLSGVYAGEIFYIRTLVDLCGIILLFAQQEQRTWLRAKRELDAMQNILTYQYEHYKLSRDNIETLNRHYHDLKHQIRVIRAEQNADKKAEYLDEMESGIKMFEAQNKTGNPVLDIILTEKSMYCVRNGINFTCVADGKLLDFMNAMDLCAIVGNALDNAIESITALADPEKRIIKMAVYAQGDFLMMRFENYSEQKLSFNGDLPVTTKTERENHGYGLKSIRYSVEKYGGSVKISAEDNWFCLYLLIPRKESPEAANGCVDTDCVRQGG